MALNLRVMDIEPITDRICQFTFADPDGGELPSYTAGAHVDFDLGNAGVRSYSLVDFETPGNAPKTYCVSVQREEDGKGGSQAMHQLSVGDTLSASDPKNSFELHKGDTPALLIAGGIGVTPIVSFATELAARGTEFQMHYAARSKSVCAYPDQLQVALGDKLTLWFDEAQQIDLTAVFAGGPKGAHMYCCGPEPMINAVRAAAQAAGWPADHIHFELFTAPDAQEGDTAFEVEIADGRVFTIPADKTIVDVLEDEGVDVMYDCQRGDCGICQCDVLEGEPDHRDVVLSEAERAAGDVMQICVSRAKSARLKLDI